MILLWWVATSVANAATTRQLTIVMDLLETPEPHPYGITRDQYRYHGVDTRVRGRRKEVVVADDGKLRVTCLAPTRHQIGVRVDYDTGRYPEHLPDQISCRVANIDLDVTFRVRPPLYSSREEQAVGPDAPAEWRRWSSPSMLETGERRFALPRDTDWQVGEVPAIRDDGTPWTGVTCIVSVIPEGPLLDVRVDDGGLGDSTGRCALPTGDGTATDIPVYVVTLRGR